MTGKIRLSYAQLFEPKSINGSDPKYSTAILIPKTDNETIAKIEKAIEEAAQQGAAKFGSAWPTKASMLKLPLRDGDAEKDDEVYAGHYFLNANSKTKPGVVDQNVVPILDQEEVYSGCYARVTLSFFPFNAQGNRGVGVGLGNVQKLADGERLAGGPSAEDEFKAFATPQTNNTGGFGAATEQQEGGDDFLS